MKSVLLDRILHHFNSSVSRLVPVRAEGDDQQLSADRLLVSTCLITSIFSLLYVWVSLIIDFRIGVGLMLGCFALLYLILFLFRATGRSHLCVNLYLATCGIVAILGCSFFSGGIRSMVFPWLALVPVVGVMLLGYCRDALFWFLFSCVVALSYGIAAGLGFSFPELYQTEYLRFFYTICITGLVMILFFIALTFHHNWSVALRKITDQNDELREARILAEAAVRTKSEFLANMSHEIRTPMNAILGFTALCQKTGLDPKQQNYLQRIESASISLLGVVNDILDFSKIEAGKMRIEEVDFSLEEVVGNITDMFGVEIAGKGLELVSSIDPAIPLNLIGDPLRLGQALTNLAGNAVKFTEKGSILIRAEHVRRDGTGALVRFTVTDTGIGMSEEEQSRLFVAFSQADTSVTRKYGGTGLGLAITRNLVELMGGEISVTSTPGRGSSFSFTTPFRLNDQLAGSPPPLPVALTNLKVLVVDDNEYSRQVLLEQLTGFRLEAVAVDSGRAALDILREGAEGNPFDLALIDWRMPEMDGLETVKRMHRELKLDRLPVTIMVTAFERDEVLRQAEEIGISSLLTKPVCASLLFDTIVRSFCHWPQGAAVRATPGKARVQLDPVRGARVLLVEDNPINQQVAAELLKGAGLVTDIAANGREAIAAVFSSDYDLVLMDIQMPVMGGYEATAMIRDNERYAGLPIVAMTAHTMSGVREECLAAGMNDYLSKPIDPDRLFEVLLRWIKPGDRPLPAREPEAGGGDGYAPLPRAIEGFDLGAGLDLLDHNHPLYREMLIDFATRSIAKCRRLPELIRKGERDEARRLTHSLRGIAGNLSATDIYRLASELEELLEGPATAAEEELLAALQRACEVVSRSVAPLIQEIQEGQESLTDPAGNGA